MPFRKHQANKTSNQALEHEQLMTLINSLADAVIALNENLQIIRYNAAALDILDINNLSLMTPLESVFKPIDKNNQNVDINAFIKQTKVPVVNRDYRLTYADGSKINLYLSLAPVRLSYGKSGQKGFVMLLRDITREKSLEEERDEFISVTSHELRTPIAIAEGNLSNALFMSNKTETPDSIKETLKAAHDQVLFLADLINDLSTLSRAERGTLQIDITDIDINELVEDLKRSYDKQVKDKGLNLVTEIRSTNQQINSCRLYLREILQNFITNAIKYTEQGQITITVEDIDKGIKFSVKDSGIGISVADQDRVFDKFFRSEDYRTRQANGTGLGLYVTVKLARLIHADLGLDSELNQGSTFSVAVPDLKPDNA